MLKRLVLIFVAVFAILQYGRASHLMGGEITWECQPSGLFIVYMKLYQDCRGNQILGGNENIEVWNHPTLSQISMNFIAENDISPSCGAGGPNIVCSDEVPGAVKEFIYASDPIMISGIPPAQGWVFTWDVCCRNGTIVNLQNPDTQGATIRAVMYPFSGQNTFPCFDSSPDFAEIPTAIVCTGGDFTYNHNASDRDLDSIAYKWAEPLDNFNTWNPPAAPNPLAFENPYSFSSPLPGNPNLDVSTGEVAFNANIQGEFVTVIKVESWRCGQMISEVFREIQLIITNCSANDPPDVSILDMAGNPISYFDTVHVGDVVQFQLKGVDVGQDVTLSSSSTQYGTNFANPNSGCINPPCAVLAPPPVTGSITQSDSLAVMFNWATDCNHISFSDVCATASNTYTFVFNIQDDNCPAAGKSVATVALTVLALPTIDPPELHCAAVNPVNGDVTLNWDIPIDTATTFNSYHVYYATAPNGPYTIVDSIFNYNQTNYTHIGANADQQSVYYYMRTRSGCLGAVFTEQSDTLQTIDVNPIFNSATGTINLTWNELHSPLLSSSETWYRIYKESPIGSWTLFDSTQNNSYIDTTLNCNDSITYWIQIDDNLTCTSMSNYGGVGYNNILPVPDFSSTTACIGDSTFFTDLSTGTFESIDTWQWDFGDGGTDTLQNPDYLFTASGLHNVKLVISTGIGCADSITKTVTVNALPIPDAGLADSVCVFDTTQLVGDGGWIDIAWGPNLGLSDTTIINPEAFPLTTTDYIYYVTDVNGCIGTDTVEIVVHGLPNPILADLAQFCIGDSTQIVAGGGDTYVWAPILGLNDSNIPNPYAQPADTAQYFVTITDGNGCSNDDSIIVYLNPLPIVDAGLDRQLCINDTTLLTASGGDVYAWTPTLGLLTPALATTFAHPTDTTMYYVEVTDSNGCVNIDSVLITVNPLPVLTTGIDRQICIGDTTELIATGGAIYSWTPTAELATPANDSTLAWPTDTTNYIVEVTDSNACVNFDSILVTVNPLPVIDAGPSVQICIGDTTELVALGGLSYLWSPTDSLSDSTNDSTYAWPTDTTEYFVQVTDSNGCISIDSVTVIVNPLPIVDAGLDRQLCINDTTLLTASGGDVYAWTPTLGLLTPALATTFAHPTDTTMYYVEVTDSNGCVNIDSVLITVNPLPITNAGADIQICMGDTAELTVVGTDFYVWSPADSLSSTTNDTVYSWVIDTTTYIVLVSDTNGCELADTITVIVNPIPVLDLGADLYMCPTDTLLLVATGGEIYSWSPTNSSGTPNNDSTLIWPLDTTEYIVVVTDTNGCVSSDSLIVDVNPVVPTDAGTDTSICVFDSIMVGGNPTSPNGTNYSWNTLNGLSDSTIANPMVSPSDTIIYWVNTLNHVCNGTDTVVVVVHQLPLVEAGSNAQVCINDTIELVATGAETYVWSPLDSISNVNNDSVRVWPTDTSTYFVQGTDIFGCVNVDIVDVIVNSLPIVYAGPDVQICIEDSIQLIATGGTDYTWSPSDSLSNTKNDTVWAYPADTSVYYVIVADSNGCIGSDSLVVTVNPFPVIDVGSAHQICIGDVTTLSAAGGESYIWNSTDTVSLASNDTIEVSPNDTTTYYVEVSDSNNCVSYDSVIVTVNPLPIIIVGLDVQICLYDSVQLIVSGAEIYSWLTIDSISSLINDTVTVWPFDTLEYIVEGTDSNFCVNYDSIMVTVNPLPIVDAGLDTISCKADLVNLGGNSTGPLGADYLWTPSVNVSDSIIANPTANPFNTTTYLVMVTDTNGCVHYDSTTVNIFSIYTISDTVICERQSLDLFAGPISGISPYSYNWSPTEELISSSTDTVNASPLELTIYTVTVSDGNGCVEFGAVEVQVDDAPEASFSIEYTPSCEEVTIHFTNTSENGTEYFWDFGEGFASTEDNPEHTESYGETLEITLMVENENCGDTSIYNYTLDDFSDYVNINSIEAFSPNGDGINDVFTVEINNEMLECTDLKIFNRWGVQMFESTTDIKYWDGRDKSGDLVSAGVYFYVFKIGGFTVKSSLTVFY